MTLHRPALIFCLALAAFPILPVLPALGQTMSEQAFQARTVGDLADLCGANPRAGGREVAARNFCEGFAQGAVDVRLEAARVMHEKAPFCFPNPAPSRSTTLAQFTAWARANNGAHRSEPAAHGLFAFMTDRFSCPS